MILLKSHIKPSGLGLLRDGDHIVRIESVAEALAPINPLFSDRTPQISIRYKSNSGFITQWINVTGYMTEPDYQSDVIFNGITFKEHYGVEYAVDVFTNRRIENEEKTKTALHILGRIGHCAGIEKDANFELADLVGLEIGIRILNQKVIKTFRKI